MSYKKLLSYFIIGLSFSTNSFAATKSCEKLEIPIKFDAYGLPTIELNINGKNHNALLDLGSLDGIHLPLSEMKKMPNLKYTGNTVKSSNISGDVFDAKEFVIKSLKIGCVSFDNIQGLELVPWAASIGNDEINQQEEQIIIGLDFFKNKNLIINYAAKMITIQNASAPSLTANSDKSAIPYNLSKEGISIKLSSSNADYQMVLDTGASNSIFVANKVNSKDNVKTCDFDLGPNLKCQMFNSNLKVLAYDFRSNLLLYPIDPRFKMDGLLGSDFFNQFIVKIDFLNKTILLNPTAE